MPIVVDSYGVGVGNFDASTLLFVGVDDWGKTGQFHVNYRSVGTPMGFLSLEFDGSPIGLALPAQVEGTLEGQARLWHQGNHSLRVRHDGIVVFERNVMVSTEELRQRLSTAKDEVPNLLVAQLVDLGEKVDDGHVIRAVAAPWFEILRRLKQDRDFIYKLSPEQFEQLIAGAYEREGASEVILTPRSGDHGRDIIATFPAFGTIRILDQVKRYSPGQLVTAHDVRALYGVLSADLGATKGYVTTTSEFAPKVIEEFKSQMPGRLTLQAKDDLLSWLESLV